MVSGAFQARADSELGRPFRKVAAFEAAGPSS